MKQLGILDSAFINLEHRNTPQHIGGVGIYDPSTAPDGKVRFKQLLSNYEQRLDKLPIFRTRLVEVPGGLDRPYWVIDENFDVEFHLRHIALPEPGDWRQLCIQIARLHARPIDMSRPLWECYIIEGLDNIPDLPAGSFAIYTKMHHSLVDGAGSDSFMSALHDLEPDPEPREKDTQVELRYKDTPIGSTQLIGQALLNRAKNTVPFTRGLFNAAKDVTSMLRKVQKEELPSLPTTAPKTRFNNPVGPHRVFDAAVFQLDDFKSVKNATGTTINDVAVAVVSGAIRLYLEHHNDLPDESLAISIPVNMRGRRNDTNDDNNQVGSTMGYMHTNIENPLERLMAIHDSLNDAKQFIDTPFVDMMRIPGTVSPYLSKAIAQMYVNRELTRRMPIGDCGVLTNVPGPSFDLYSAGAKMVRYFCLGLLTPGSALFHAVFSMGKIITISVTSDREAMPDPDFYKSCLERSFQELKRAALKTSSAPAREPAKKSKSKAKSKAKAKAKAKVKVKARTRSKSRPATNGSGKVDVDAPTAEI